MGWGTQPILRLGLSCQDSFALPSAFHYFSFPDYFGSWLPWELSLWKAQASFSSYPCPPPSLFLLNWFLVPWLSGRLFILIATPQNKSLMNQLVGRAISSRLPPGSGGGAWPVSHWPSTQPGSGGQVLGNNLCMGSAFFRCSLEMGTVCPPQASEASAEGTSLALWLPRPQSHSSKPKGVYAEYLTIQTRGVSLKN